MNKFEHRYQIWTAATKDGLALQWPEPGKPEQKKHLVRPAKPINKLDDLDTTMLLYGYGLPIELALEGICTLPNGQATKCKTKKISSESVDVVYDDFSSEPREELPEGVPVNLNLDEIGSFRGTLKSQNQQGFQVTVDGAYKKVLGAKLSHIAVQRGITPENILPVIPLETRIEPISKDCWFLDHTGTLRKAAIVNLSQLDALLRASIIPPLGAKITFRGPRRYAAEVSSIFKIGFMVKFCNQLPVQDFTTAIKLSDV